MLSRILLSPPSNMTNMKKIYLSILILLLCLFLAQCSRKSSSGGSGKASTFKRITQVPQGEIVIDGRVEDWNDIEPLTSDVGSKERGKSPPKIDLKSVKVTCDNDNLYLLLEAIPVGSGIVSICVDSDGNESTGVDSLLIGKKMKMVKFQAGWDYIIKLTYSFHAGPTIKTRPMLISQVEKFEKIKYGYRSKLVFEHKNNIHHPSYVGVEGRFQELRVPLQTLNIRPPADIAFLFMEGGETMAKYDKHCQFIKVTIK